MKLNNYIFKYTSYNQLYQSIKELYRFEILDSSLEYLTTLEMEIKLKGFINKVA